MAHKGKIWPFLFERDLSLTTNWGNRQCQKYKFVVAGTPHGTLTAGWMGQTIISELGVADYDLRQITYRIPPPSGADPTTEVIIRYVIKTATPAYESSAEFWHAGTRMGRRKEDLDYTQIITSHTSPINQDLVNSTLFSFLAFEQLFPVRW